MSAICENFSKCKAITVAESGIDRRALLMQELKNDKDGWRETKSEWERNMKRNILKVKLLTPKRSRTYHLRSHQDLGWRVAKQSGKRYKHRVSLSARRREGRWLMKNKNSSESGMEVEYQRKGKLEW